MRSLRSLRLMAENLEGGRVSETPKQREYFGFIVQECRRLTSLIENVLDFSRIEQGRKQYEFEPTNVVELVAQTVKLMETNAAEKQVRLIFETSNIQFRSDGTQKQHPTFNIQSAAEPIHNSQATIRLSVIDCGEGIPAEEHEKIFERFCRRGSELRRETQGVGIGLAL